MTRPNTDLGAALDSLNEAYDAIREITGTEAYGRVRRWIDAVAAAQQAGMVTHKDPARLMAAQIRLQQLVALREALSELEGAHHQTGFLTDQ